MNERLYIIFGMGNDSVGLVGKITTPISKMNGNIVDLRQDVMHGLFTIFLVVDLSDSDVEMKEFNKLIDKISEDTNLKLYIDKYKPVPRDPNKKNVLLILIGNDKPGIIATISKTMSDHNINIEFSQVVAREGIFLMELLTDVSNCNLPIDNLKKVLSYKMLALNINTMFQTSDVFNKKKRVIVFDISSSFIDTITMREILNQADIKADVLKSKYPADDVSKSLHNAAALVDNLPLDLINSIIESINITPSTTELLQTLKIMGYKIAVISNAFTIFTDFMKKKLDIDYAFGCDIPINDDLKTVEGDLGKEFFIPNYKEKLISQIMAKESIARDDITIIRDSAASGENGSGIGLVFSMKVMLDYFNQHILTKDALTGILGSFGIPRL